jgi:hypothetical protein
MSQRGQCQRVLVKTGDVTRDILLHQEEHNCLKGGAHEETLRPWKKVTRVGTQGFGVTQRTRQPVLDNEVR